MSATCVTNLGQMRSLATVGTLVHMSERLLHDALVDLLGRFHRHGHARFVHAPLLVPMSLHDNERLSSAVQCRIGPGYKYLMLPWWIACCACCGRFLQPHSHVASPLVRGPLSDHRVSSTALDVSSKQYGAGPFDAPHLVIAYLCACVATVPTLVYGVRGFPAFGFLGTLLCFRLRVEPVPILVISCVTPSWPRLWVVPSHLWACSIEILWFPAFRRVGEALNPGPASESFHEVDVSQCLQIGNLNAGSLLFKEDLLCSLGHGVWTASETHHTARAVPIIKHRLWQEGFNACFSAPVEPYSTGVAQLKGLAAGTACFTDLPIRTTPGALPLEVMHSTRFLQSFIQVSTHCVLQVVTLYGPPVSVAHVQPIRTTNLLLEAAFKVAASFQGPSVIAGDLNTTLESLPAWKLLANRGWIDAALWSSETLRHPLLPTCRDATRRSFLLVNPRAAQALRVADVVPDFLFDSHPLLVGFFDLQAFKAPKWKCLLPKTFDNIMFNATCLDACASKAASRLADAIPKAIQFQDLSKGFRQWAEECESVFIHSAVWSDGQPRKLPPGYRGRCKKFKPVLQPCSVPVVPKARDGDFDAALTQSNIFLRRLLRQVHRLQSLCRLTQRIATLALPFNHACVNSAAQLWNACKNAKGFPGSFCQWSLLEQGIFMTVNVPPPALCGEIYQAVRDFFIAQERLYILTKAAESREDLLLDWKRGGAKAYRQLKNSEQCQLSHIVRITPLPVKAVRWPKTGRTKIPLKSTVDLSIGDVLVYHQKEFVVQNVHESAVWVHPPLTPQEWPPDISIKKTLVCPSEIDHEIRTVWGQWFHRDNDHTCWTDAMMYVDSMPEHVPMPYVPFSVDKWTHMLKGVSTKSARGSCGFSVQELKLIPDALLQPLFELFHAIEDGHSWPEALVFAMVMCLPKVEGPCTALQIRPITVLSRLYRCWARYRSSEIAEWLSSKLPPTLAGGVKGMSVTDINAMVANYLESSFCQGLSRVGGVFDIIKCFNALPREPILFLMIQLGINCSYVEAYHNMLSSFTRTFVVQGSAGVAENSETGFPGGCSMSVIAMTCMALLAHSVLSSKGASPFIFADNWSFASHTLEAGQAAFTALCDVCDAFQLELSPEKSWVWATSSKLRKQLRQVAYRGVPIPLVWHAKDLGVDVNYTLRRQKTVWRSRFHKMRNSMSKVRVSKLPVHCKKRLAISGGSSSCTFGGPLLHVSASEFKTWRAAIAKALGFNRPGENAKIALALAGDVIDPQLSDFFQKCCFWRRFFWKFPDLKNEFFHTLNCAGLPNRPAGSFVAAAATIGWKPEGLMLHHPWFGSLDWLRCSSKFLWFALSQTWVLKVCAELNETRPGFNLAAVDISGMKDLLSKLHPTALGAIRFYVHGGNFTHDVLTKWDASKTLQCPNCDMPDFKHHRVFQCPAYDDFRADFPGLFSKLQRLPEGVWRFGLIPLCAQPWPLFAALHSATLHLKVPSNDDPLHIFVDGSCFWPQNRLFSVSAAAAVVADMSCNGEGIVHSLVLPGCEQSNDRAEVCAILLALQLSLRCTVYSDCKYAVDAARIRLECLQTLRVPPAMTHIDLWEKFDTLLVDRPTGSVEFVKVKAHVSSFIELPPFLDRCRHYNKRADSAAKAAVKNADVFSFNQIRAVC